MMTTTPRNQREQRIQNAEIGAVWMFCSNSGEKRPGIIIAFHGADVFVDMPFFGELLRCSFPARVLATEATFPVARLRV